MAAEVRGGRDLRHHHEPRASRPARPGRLSNGPDQPADRLVRAAGLAPETDQTTALADFARALLPRDRQAMRRSPPAWAFPSGRTEASGTDSPGEDRAPPARRSGASGGNRRPRDPLGLEDASALARHLDRCLGVGDLIPPAPRRSSSSSRSPMGPGCPSTTGPLGRRRCTTRFCIRRGREAGPPGGHPAAPAGRPLRVRFDDETETTCPRPGVLDCLDKSWASRAPHSCYGLWAYPAAGRPRSRNTCLLLGQHGPVPATACVPRRRISEKRVPVRYLRMFADLQWFDGTDLQPIPDAPLFDTLSLVTIDSPAADAGDDPLGATLTATSWRADNREAGRLLELPRQLGVDTGAEVTAAAAACLGRTDRRRQFAAVPARWNAGGSGRPVQLRDPLLQAQEPGNTSRRG